MEYGRKRALEVGRCVCPINIIFKTDPLSNIILASVKHTHTHPVLPVLSQPLNSLHHSVSMLSLPIVCQSVKMPRKKLKGLLDQLLGTHSYVITISLITLLSSKNNHGDQHLWFLSFSISLL